MFWFENKYFINFKILFIFISRQPFFLSHMYHFSSITMVIRIRRFDDSTTSELHEPAGNRSTKFKSNFYHFCSLRSKCCQISPRFVGRFLPQRRKQTSFLPSSVPFAHFKKFLRWNFRIFRFSYSRDFYFCLLRASNDSFLTRIFQVRIF